MVLYDAVKVDELHVGVVKNLHLNGLFEKEHRAATGELFDIAGVGPAVNQRQQDFRQTALATGPCENRIMSQMSLLALSNKFC